MLLYKRPSGPVVNSYFVQLAQDFLKLKIESCFEGTDVLHCFVLLTLQKTFKLPHLVLHMIPVGLEDELLLKKVLIALVLYTGGALDIFNFLGHSC